MYQIRMYKLTVMFEYKIATKLQGMVKRVHVHSELPGMVVPSLAASKQPLNLINLCKPCNQGGLVLWIRCERAHTHEHTSQKTE